MSLAVSRVLILGGRRGGDDAVAGVSGVSHKALAPVLGVPMLARVVATLREALPDAVIGIAIDRTPDVSPLLDRLAADGGIVVVEPGPSPCATVAKALAMPGLGQPLLIATADHPLLTPEMVRHFLGQVPAGTDAAVALATRETISARYTSRRTYWEFRDRAVSGCNLFFLGPNAAAVVRFWQRLENDRKKPWKMVRHLGLASLLLFVARRLSLQGALDRLGRRAGARAVAVDMPFAEAAIDVDRPADLELAERILADRAR